MIFFLFLIYKLKTIDGQLADHLKPIFIVLALKVAEIINFKYFKKKIHVFTCIAF